MKIFCEEVGARGLSVEEAVERVLELLGEQVWV